MCHLDVHPGARFLTCYPIDPIVIGCHRYHHNPKTWKILEGEPTNIYHLWCTPHVFPASNPWWTSLGHWGPSHIPSNLIGSTVSWCRQINIFLKTSPSRFTQSSDPHQKTSKINQKSLDPNRGLRSANELGHFVAILAMLLGQLLVQVVAPAATDTEYQWIYKTNSSMSIQKHHTKFMDIEWHSDITIDIEIGFWWMLVEQATWKLPQPQATGNMNHWNIDGVDTVEPSMESCLNMFKLAALMRIFHWYGWGYSTVFIHWNIDADIPLIWWANHGGIGLITARKGLENGSTRLHDIISWVSRWCLKHGKSHGFSHGLFKLSCSPHILSDFNVTSMAWPKTPQLHRSGGLPSWSFLFIFRPRTQLAPNHRNVKHLGVLGISMCWISLKSVIDSLAWVRFCICRLWSFSRIALVQCGSLMSRKG